MYAAQRLRWRRIIALFILASFVLVACGTGVESQNWPGITADDPIVYVAYGPKVLAVDIAERELLWSFPEESRPGLYFYAPPSVNDASLVLGDFGVAGGFFSPGTTVTIYSLQRGAGGAMPNVVWSRDDLATDRIVAGALQANGTVFVGTSDNKLLALDAQNGELQWEFETQHSIWAEPVLGDEVVYVASLDNFVYALAFDTGALLWQSELGGSIASQPVLVDGVLYVSSFDRAVHALEASSGEQLWQADADEWVWGGPTVNDGAVYFADLDGHVYAADRDSGELLWQEQVAGVVQSAPLYADGKLFVAAGDAAGEEEERRGRVVAYDAESGEALWEMPTPAPAFTRPVQVGENVVVAAVEGTVLHLQVFNMESGALEWTFSPPSE